MGVDQTPPLSLLSFVGKMFYSSTIEVFKRAFKHSRNVVEIDVSELRDEYPADYVASRACYNTMLIYMFAHNMKCST